MRRSFQRGALKLRNRRWTLQWRSEPDELGKRKTRTIRIGSSSAFRSRAAARLEADRVLARLGLGEILQGKAIEFEAFAKSCAPALLQTYSRATAASYRSALHRHLLPAFRGKRLHELTTGAIGAYVAKAAAAGVTRSVLVQHLNLVRALLDHAIQLGYAAAPLVRKSIRLPPKGLARERAYLLPEQCRQILEAAPWPWRALFALGAFLGLRAGELLAMEWQHLDLARGVLLVRQAAGHGRLKILKSATSLADLPLSPELLQLLADFRAWRRSELAGVEPSGLLFPSPRGRPRWLAGILTTHWHPLLKRLGLPRCGIHALRHGAATLMFREGASAPTVQSLMRHANIATTMRYSHVIAEDLRRAADAAGKRIAGVTPT